MKDTIKVDNREFVLEVSNTTYGKEFDRIKSRYEGDTNYGPCGYGGVYKEFLFVSDNGEEVLINVASYEDKYDNPNEPGSYATYVTEVYSERPLEETTKGNLYEEA